MIGENKMKEPIIVKTKLTGELIYRSNIVTMKRYSWFLGLIGLIFMIATFIYFMYQENATDTLVGVLFLVIDIFFLVSIFILPKFAKKHDDKYIKENEIVITFYEDYFNIDVSGGKLGEKFITFKSIFRFLDEAYKFKREYRIEDIKYSDMKSCLVTDDLFMLRGTSYEDLILFDKSDIEDDKDVELKSFLKHKLGRRYKGEK